MILIGNNCIPAFVYRNYYESPYNNPFIAGNMEIEDYIYLVNEYDKSLKDCYDFYIDWSIERRLIHNDFSYRKMITGIYANKIKYKFLHATHNHEDIENLIERTNIRIDRWKEIRDKELTIFSYVQTSWDTYDQLQKLININLNEKNRLIIYTWKHIKSNKENIIVKYFEPENIEDKNNFHYKYDLIGYHPKFLEVFEDFKTYLSINNIEYHT